MGWYSDYIQALNDTFAVGELDYSAYCILKEAAQRLRALRNAQTRSDFVHGSHQPRG